MDCRVKFLTFCVWVYFSKVIVGQSVVNMIIVSVEVQGHVNVRLEMNYHVD